MSGQDTKSLFLQYINTFNVSLTKHKETPIYKQILEFGEKIFGDKIIGVEIYHEDDERPD